MKKKEFLDYWRSLDEAPATDIKMLPVFYQHKGSTYDEDGIRITGRKTFIESVLRTLKPLLAYENGQTRLQVTMQETKDRETGVKTGTWNCYIQVHERGGQAKAVNGFVSAITGQEELVSQGY